MALGAGQVLRHGHMGDLGCAFVGVVRTRKDTTPFKIEFRKECRSDSDHPHHPSPIQWFSSRAGSSPNGSNVGCRFAGVASPSRAMAVARSEERRGGKEWVRRWQVRGWENEE